MATQPASSKAMRPNTFGAQPSDGNRMVIGGYGSWFQTQDASDTPVLSPASVSTSAVTTLKVPNNALAVTLTPAANPIYVSEVSGTSSLAQYIVIPAGTSVTLQVARQQYLYVIANTGAASVSFAFQCL